MVTEFKTNKVLFHSVETAESGKTRVVTDSC